MSVGWKGYLKTALISTAGGVVVAVACAAGWMVVNMDKPWREGIQDIGGDCTRSFAASPVTTHGATITVDARPKGCGYRFAVQREAGTVAHYTLEVEKGALDAGEMQISVIAYDGQRKLDRDQRRFQAPSDLSGLRLPLDVPDLGQLPVAVLTSGRTGSSGDAMVVAFRGRANSRSFGAPTFGVPTANAGHRLADGTVLQLTGALFVDRNGRGDGTSLVPDEPVRELGVGDRTRQAAIEWLRQQR